MLVYTILIIIITTILLFGLFFYVVSIFNVPIKRRFLFLLSCLFWPISISLIFLYISILDRYKSRKLFF